jgi:hypothetical protein
MPDLELPGQRHDSLPLSQYEPDDKPDDESDHDSELDEIPDSGSLEDQRASSRSPSPDLPPALDQSRSPEPENRAGGDVPETFFLVIDNISISMKFIEYVKKALLEDHLDKDAIYRICNPPENELHLDDPDDRYSIDVFLVITSASEATYNKIHLATLRRYPDSRMLT